MANRSSAAHILEGKAATVQHYTTPNPSSVKTLASKEELSPITLERKGQ